MTPVTEARNRLDEMIDEVSNGSTVEISRNGEPVAVLMGYEEYESLIETLDILSDEEAMASIEQGRRDIAAGDLVDVEGSVRELIA